MAGCQAICRLHRERILAKDSERQTEESEREPIGSIKKRWRPLYSILFTLQTLLGIAFVVWREIVWVSDDTLVDTISAIPLGILVVGGAAAITTGIIPEALDIMLGVRDFINEYLEERRKRAHAEGLAEGFTEGHSEGLAEGRAEAQSEFDEWYKRWKDAQDRDEPFDEPPPGSSQP